MLFIIKGRCSRMSQWNGNGMLSISLTSMLHIATLILFAKSLYYPDSPYIHELNL